jgi:SpoVK/Ycf46/Vps4 family AAA+-type ATPase
MIAEAIAAEVDAGFFSVRCSDIVGKYFGEAEKNVRGLFDAARSSSPSIVFFDEFEALGSHRGEGSGVMNRLVPELLTQINGFSVSDGNSLLFLAATNRPWDIDSAFFRPSRLADKIYVGLPDLDARMFLINRAIGLAPRDGDVDMNEIGILTDGYNADDVVQMCEAIKDGPILRSIKRDDGELDNITKGDVFNAMERLPSSVRQGDIDAIRQWERDSLNRSRN